MLARPKQPAAPNEGGGVAEASDTSARPRGARATTPVASMPSRSFARGDAGYPAGFDALHDPPAFAVVWGGELPDWRQAVAIVGSRAATPYGLALAERLARDVVSQGVTVVSGLARGIDSAAHAGALAGGGRTVAVIASAFDSIPRGPAADLARRIAGSGAVLSEVARGGPFGPGAFVKRNRLIAASAAATVVVEAAEDGGALTTAAFARAIGRVVLAVPGDVDRSASRGTLSLLRSGARVCADAGDVLAAMTPPAGPGAAGTRAPLVAQLTAKPASVEELARACGLDVSEAMALLLRLQWSGLAVSHPGGRWSSRRSP